MINLIQIDKSGREIFEKDYSIALALNKKDIYGCNISQGIKDVVLNEFRNNKLWKLDNSIKKERSRLAIRLHTSIVILLIKKALYGIGSSSLINIQICNDFDGHFHEIKEMIYSNISKLMPSFNKEDIVLAKFQKPSVIDTAAKNFREKNNDSKIYSHLEINLEELLMLMRR